MEDTYKIPEIQEIPGGEVTAATILAMMERVMSDTEDIKSAIETIAAMDDKPVAGTMMMKSTPVAQTVLYREQTKQKYLEILEKMYCNLRPEDLAARREDAIREHEFNEARRNNLLSRLENLDEDAQADIIRDELSKLK